MSSDSSAQVLRNSRPEFRLLSSDPWRHVTFIVLVLRIYN